MSRWSEGEFEIYQQRRKAPVRPAPVKRPSPHAKPMYALGRLPVGKMNPTETEYASHLETMKAAGEILWYRFEGIKLRLADQTFLTVDFSVLAKDFVLEMHEVKGFWLDDARAKIKIAAAQYPFRFLAVTKKKKKDGGGWAVENF